MLRTGLLVGSAAALGGVAALGAVALAARFRGGMDWNGKVVLITGGSHGLGVALARAFGREGALLALCARGEEELGRAADDLRERGVEVFTFPCDVGDRVQAEQAIAETVRRFGRIDVLVNNAGMIQVGPVESAKIEDFERAMDTMFWGVVYTSLAALPHLRQRPEARIVNVTSIGAKVAVPHLLPYSCAKFAAAAFSEGLRAELSGSPVKVVTIAPGLMRTGSHLNARFQGDPEGEAAWFSVAASTPGLAMHANRAARQILSAARTGAAERMLGLPANAMARFHGLFPGLTADILGMAGRLLPGNGGQVATGAETEILERPWMRLLTFAGRQAARQFLQPAMRGRELTDEISYAE